MRQKTMKFHNPYKPKPKYGEMIEFMKVLYGKRDVEYKSRKGKRSATDIKA